MKTRKTICRLLLAAGTIAGAFVTETSCTKVGFREGGTIRFSASNSAARTRTSYSKEGRTGSDGLLNLERIDWKEGDLITIYSPQAVMADGTDPVCDYRVDSHETLSGNLTSRATVNPSVAGAGLGWGSGTHYFYAVYPSAETEAFTAAEKAKTGLDDTRWKGTVAADQSPLANGLGGTASAPEIAAKMQYAHMFATATSEPVPSVDLPFYPEFTAFEFQVGSGKNPVVDLTSFTLTAAAGQNAPAGDFAYLLADVDTESASDPLALSKFAFSNTSQSITVDFTKLSAGKLTVESGKPVTFTVVALPQQLSGLSITFTGDQIGTRTLKLNDSAGTPLVYAARQKHRLYGLSFPTVVTAGGEEIEWDQEAIGEDILWDDPVYIFGNVSGTEIEGNLSPVTVEYTGGSGSLADAFVSYKTTDGGVTKTAVPFTLEYSEDGGTTWSTTPPSWLTPDGSIDYDGSASGQTMGITVAPQVNSAPDPHHDALVANGSFTTAFDLSTKNVATGGTVSRTTANCYVVDRPGNYKFPLVYGNGVDWTKNTTTGINEDAYRAKAGVGGAYRADAGVTNYLGRFKDHLDNNITSPYIATQQSGKAMSAVLVWADVQGLVSVDPAISGSGQNAYVTFSVPAATITQGNALVAVLVDDNGDNTPETIAWSWHVWVTEEDLTALTEGSNSNYFAPVDIGWCEGRTTETYAARTCRVRATQAGSGLARTATLTQTEGVVVTGGNSPYYQFGRKDPMRASNGKGNTFKTYYPSKSAYAPAVADAPVSIGAAIRSPYTFYRKEYSDWCSTTYHNHWSSTMDGTGTGQNANAKTKTVYDPSPVGFRVPALDAWNGFNRSNFTWGTVNGDNGRTYTPSGLFFPASGNRYTSGGVGNVGSIGNHWSSSPSSAMFAYGLYFDSDGVGLVYTYTGRTFGFPVRCVKE